MALATKRISPLTTGHTNGAINHTTTSDHTSGAPPGEVSLIHLLSYQRSGSSFTASVFGSNHETFFVFEPLDMLYSAMFGISPGWTVPADIFYNRDGTLRLIPEEEIAMMEWTLDMAFTCNMSSYPVSMLINKMWKVFAGETPNLKDYVKCISSKPEASRCINHLSGLCPKRFDGKVRNLIMCRDVLWNSNKWGSDTIRIKTIAGNNARKFQSYFACLGRHTEHARQCARKYLDERCAQKTIRAVKTVRAPMEVSGRLLEKYPNSRVFHLLRDPRGATRSRTRALWSLGQGEGKTIRNHARWYCPNVVRDFKQLKDLSKIYTGRTMCVIYDGFVRSPLNITDKMYAVLGKTVPVETKKWIRLKTSTSKLNVTKTTNGKKVTGAVVHPNSTSVAIAWKSFYTYDQVQEIRKECQEFYRVVDYPWE